MGCKSNKILCISKTKADVIFLSDTRLNTEANKSGLNNLTKFFFFNGYNIYHNSLGPNRGTAILISSKLNTELINTVGDPLGNFIIIKCKINDKLMCLGSIWGPEDDAVMESSGSSSDASMSSLDCQFLVGDYLWPKLGRKHFNLQSN